MKLNKIIIHKFLRQNTFILYIYFWIETLKNFFSIFSPKQSINLIQNKTKLFLMNEENWSQSSEKAEDPIPLGLVDIEECEDLIQQNKSEK